MSFTEASAKLLLYLIDLNEGHLLIIDITNVHGHGREYTRPKLNWTHSWIRGEINFLRSFLMWFHVREYGYCYLGEGGADVGQPKSTKIQYMRLCTLNYFCIS